MFIVQNDRIQKETAPEKVLRLALNLPQSQGELEREAIRIENHLENLGQPMTALGEELQAQLASAMEYLLEGIFTLLDAESNDDLDKGCVAVLQCHALVQDLQETVAEWEQDALLVA